MQEDTLSTLRQRHPGLEERASPDMPSVLCPPESLAGLMKDLRDRCGYDLLLDITAVDHGVGQSPRFSCLYHLLDTSRHQYFRVTSACDSGSEPTMPSMTGLWPGANWHERETWDMFGIRFDGHPDLRRILMWEEYPYFPLRKDFPLAGIETPLPSSEIAERTGASLIAAPMAGGPFHAEPGLPMSAAEPRAKDESWNERRPKPSPPRES